MKKQFLLAAAACLFFFNAQAQQNFWDKTYLEVGYGFAMPVSPTEHMKTEDYNSFKNFQVGAGYQFNDQWGVRLNYTFQDFTVTNELKEGSQLNRLMVSATYNVLSAINPSSSYLHTNPFEVQVAAGVGASLMHLETYDVNKKMLHAQLGLRPMYNISNGVNVFLDASYTANFHQLYELSGYYAKADGKAVVGGNLNVLIGLQARLGK